MASKEGEEDEFCWIWRIKLSVLVVLRKIFLLADLLIAADMWRTKCFIIEQTFDFLTSPSTNCNLSLICWRRKFLNFTSISPVWEKTTARKSSPFLLAISLYLDSFCFLRTMRGCSGISSLVRVEPLIPDKVTSRSFCLPPSWGLLH